MPPKGWRKNAEGQYPQPNKDTEVVSIDEILFPKATIQKLAKAMIVDDENNSNNMSLAKDSLQALQRSATVFVSHLLFHARQVSKEANRKTVSAQDMLAAIEKAEFGGFIPEIKQKLASYEEVMNEKKQQKASERSAMSAESVAEGDEQVSSKKIKLDSVVLEDRTDVEVIESGEDEEEEEEEEGEEEEIIEVIEDEDEEIEEDEDEDDHIQGSDNNPITVLSKEEGELQGCEPEDRNTSGDEDEDDDDEDD